jgi:hypothetical protein
VNNILTVVVCINLLKHSDLCILVSAVTLLGLWAAGASNYNGHAQTEILVFKKKTVIISESSVILSEWLKNC